MGRFEIPDPPVPLKAEALDRWLEVYPLAAKRGHVDGETLATYCQMWARWREAERGIDTGGQVTRAGGKLQASPLVKIANTTAVQVRALKDRLGLASPVNEAGDTLDRRMLAAQMGVHRQTIDKWEREGMPILERGRRGRPSLYSRSAVQAWRAATAEKGEAVDAVRERARKDRAQALLAEQAHASRSGELVAVRDVEKAWTPVVTAIRTRLLAFATTHADRLARVCLLEGVRGLERELDAGMREVLLELSDPGEAA